MNFRKSLKMYSLYYKFYKGYTTKDYDSIPFNISFKKDHFLREQDGIKIYHLKTDSTEYNPCNINDPLVVDQGIKGYEPLQREYEIYIDYKQPDLNTSNLHFHGSCIGNVYWRYYNDLDHHPEILMRFWYRYDKEDYDDTSGESGAFIFNPSCFHYNSWGDRSVQSKIAFQLLDQLNINPGEYEMEAYSLDEADIYLHMWDPLSDDIAIKVDIPQEEFDEEKRNKEEQQKRWAPILEKWKNDRKIINDIS